MYSGTQYLTCDISLKNLHVGAIRIAGVWTIERIPDISQPSLANASVNHWYVMLFW